MENNKQKKNIILRILTSRFFWLLVVLFIAFGCVLSAVIKHSQEEIEKARSTYSGLSKTGGYPFSTKVEEGLYIDEYSFGSYEDDQYTSRRGIDVSVYQGDIDWARVKEAGVEFAMIRLGFTGNDSGEMFLDEYFEANVQGATEAGIDVGVYYFSQARNVDEAIAEAQFVCRNLVGKKITMPVAFDMEPLSGTESDRIHGLKMLDVTEIADAFCEVVDKHGYESILYGNPSWIFYHYNLSHLTHRKLWMAHYTYMSGLSGFPYEYVMWQYSDMGIVDGIEGYVDLDIQFIKKDENH